MKKVLFFAPGEPYEVRSYVANDKGEPVSVWGAIHALSEDCPDEWRKMAKECFELDARDAPLLMVEAVMDRVRETNAAPVWISASGRSYFEVWIDARGNHRLQVARAE